MENRPHQTLHLSSPFVVMNLLPVPLSLGDVEALQNIKPGSKGPVSMFRGEVIKLPVKVCLVNMAVVGGMSAEVYDTPFVHLLVCTAHISYIHLHPTCIVVPYVTTYACVQVCIVFIHVCTSVAYVWCFCMSGVCVRVLCVYVWCVCMCVVCVWCFCMSGVCVHVCCVCMSGVCVCGVCACVCVCVCV